MTIYISFDLDIQTFIYHLHYDVVGCAMSPHTSSTPVIYSNKGAPQLVLNGFIFKLNKKTSTKFYWKCKDVSCSAHVHTDTANNLLNTICEHNHLVEPAELEVKKFRAILKERVVNETMAIQKIYDEEMTKANLSSEALSSVPLVHRIRMTISTNISVFFLSH